MKRKWMIPFLTALGVLLAVAVGYLYFCTRSLSVSSGRCLVADNGSYLLIKDGSPIILSNTKNRKGLFDGIETGDEILVLHDGIQETYPARTGAYAVRKKSSGDINDIPQDVIDGLSELGWLRSTDETIERKPVILSGEELDTSVSWVNWSEDEHIFFSALDREKFYISSVQYLPVYKVDTTEELAEFKEGFGDILTLDSGYDEAPSFEDATSDYNETFFAENSLIITYVTSGSGSDRFGVHSVYCDGSALRVFVEQTNNPEVGTCDMAGWFLTVAMEKELITDCTEFDAVFGHPDN